MTTERYTADIFTPAPIGLGESGANRFYDIEVGAPPTLVIVEDMTKCVACHVHGHAKLEEPCEEYPCLMYLEGDSNE